MLVLPYISIANQSTNNTKMLSFAAWCNLKIGQRQGARLYSRLGGKLLGRIDVNFPSKDACKRLCYLQEQAAKLLGHPTRGYRDVLLWTNELCLTPDGFAYDDAVSPVCAEKLDSINASSRLEVSWNEDDSFAKRYLKKLGNVAIHMDDKVVISYPAPPRCYLWYENLGVTSWTFVHPRKNQVSKIDLTFLRHARCVKKVTLMSYLPINWQDCNVAELVVDLPEVMLDVNHLTSLTRVERLTLFAKTINVKSLRKLPKLECLTIEGDDNKTRTFENQALRTFLE